MKKYWLLGALSLATQFAVAVIPPDNTGVNKRDQKPDAVTADNQSQRTSDMTITKKIRQELMRDKDLSPYAQNIKIITINGKVTVKGPVRTQDEENKILSYARSVAGDANVMDEISVVPDKNI